MAVHINVFDPTKQAKKVVLITVQNNVPGSELGVSLFAYR